jgi:hypothetical protein
MPFTAPASTVESMPVTPIAGFGSEDRPPVHVSKPRAALRLDRLRLAKDILVPLRRQWKQR